jgi:hypothetical protein
MLNSLSPPENEDLQKSIAINEIESLTGGRIEITYNQVYGSYLTTNNSVERPGPDLGVWCESVNLTTDLELKSFELRKLRRRDLE